MLTEVPVKAGRRDNKHDEIENLDLTFFMAL